MWQIDYYRRKLFFFKMQKSKTIIVLELKMSFKYTKFGKCFISERVFAVTF